MVIRLGLLVAASIAAYAVKQLNIKSSRSSTLAVKPPGTRFYESYIYVCVCICARVRLCVFLYVSLIFSNLNAYEEES